MAAVENSVRDTPATRRASFTEMYREHYSAVRKYASWRCDSADLDDVVADVFLVAWRRFDEVDLSWARAWLFGVVKNVLKDHRRLRSNAARFLDHLIALRPAQYTSLDTGDLSVEDVDLLRSALSKVSEDDQEVLVLSSWYEMTAEEIAMALSITKSHVGVRLHRARTRFRTVMASLERDES